MSCPYYDLPLAAKGLDSYRYNGSMGWIMIGANSVEGALKEAERSFSVAHKAKLENLQKWDGEKYERVLFN